MSKSRLNNFQSTRRIQNEDVLVELLNGKSLSRLFEGQPGL